MISTPDRTRAVALIDEAIEVGASANSACEELQISLRTYQRWTARQGEIKVDGRPLAERPEPTNKLSVQEKRQILETCNREEYSSLAPSQIVPALADKGIYIASESSFYRVLRQADQLHRRGKAQAPRTVSKPTGYKADAPNRVWSWDITYLATTIAGMFFRLYLVMDIYSRKIVGWEVHENETAEHASGLIRKACLAEGISEHGLVLHADNGSPMKGGHDVGDLAALGCCAFLQPSVGEQ